MFEDFEKRIIQKTIRVLTEIVVDLKVDVDKNTPEDTFELIAHNKVELPKEEGNSIKARVYNDDPKAKYVEYGREPEVFNYYKNSGRRNGGAPFHRGVGAQMFKRAREKLIPKLNGKLKLITQK